MNRALLLIALTLFPLTAMGSELGSAWINPLEVCGEVDGEERAALLQRHGVEPTKRSWLQRLLRPRFSGVCG